MWKAIKFCLAAAEETKYTRIAFPAIGTGGMKYPAIILARGIKQAVENFKGTHLKNVDIVLHPTDFTNITVCQPLFLVSAI